MIILQTLNTILNSTATVLEEPELELNSEIQESKRRVSFRLPVRGELNETRAVGGSRTRIIRDTSSQRCSVISVSSSEQGDKIPTSDQEVLAIDFSVQVS